MSSMVVMLVALVALLAAAGGSSPVASVAPTFNDAGRLTNLVLTGSNHTDDPRGAGDPTTQLTKLLDLHNKLANSNFEGLEYLVSLELNENQLSALPDNLSHSFPSLEKLRIKQNPLTEISGDALRGSNLSEIIVKNNLSPLGLARRAFSGMPRLRYLQLTNCSIATLPGDLLGGSVAVTEINLSHNQIQDLPTDLFADQTSLKILFIDSNRLRVLSGATFAPLRDLSWLSLNNNNLTQIEADTFTGTNLQSLSIKNNKVRVVAAGALPASLVRLLLDSNELAALDAALPHLSFLALNDNSFSSVPAQWPRTLPALETIQLKNNAFTQLTKSDMTALSHYPRGWVHLENNRIASVLMDPETSLPIELFLEGAPLRCDCFAHAFAKRLTADNLLNDGDARCAEPEPDRVIYMKPKDFVCHLEPCPATCQCIVRPETKALEVECREQLTADQVTELETLRRQRYSGLTLNTTISYTAH